MDITMLLLFCLISLVIGAVVMLLVQYYIFFRFCKLPEQSEEQRDINVKYSLPQDIQNTAHLIRAELSASDPSSLPSPSASASASPSSSSSASLFGSKTPLVAINFVMQFLFHELKNSNRVRKWFYRKLSLELDELLAKTTTGKLFDKLTIKELELGDQFPEMKNLRVHNVELDASEGRIENLDLLLEIHYKGNFRTSIDADMVLGKKGSITLKVKHLCGLARLQFTRRPYTHWSLSFLGDPELNIDIESKYQGRQMQSNITSLISNQIRKAVRRKHTLPNYKLRYRPFFHKSPDDEMGDGDIQPNGMLHVKVSEISRLHCPEHIGIIYCTLTMAPFAFVEAHQRDDRHVIVSLDVEIHKAKNQQIGIVFKQHPDHVEISAVLPNTPACKSNLKTGDILIAIEGKMVATIQQVAKVVKALHNTVFSLRIERIVAGIIRNDAILEDLDTYEDLEDFRGGWKQASDAADPKSATMPSTKAIDFNQSRDSSLGNTPSNSPKKSKLIVKALKKTISRDNNDSIMKEIQENGKSKAKALSKAEERTPTKPSLVGDNVDYYFQHSTVDCALSGLIQMDDLCHFKLDARSKFLNVSVYGKCIGESMLLGFINIPIALLLAECCETSLSQCLKTYELNPPIVQDLKSHHLHMQSGFNANLCFGDTLLAFTWDGNPNLQSGDTPSRQLGGKMPRPKAMSLAIEKADEGADMACISRSMVTDDGPGTSAQTRSHDFVRKHFQRATQCDFCGKKIWLKDAVQCRECSMCCHKKCVNKCQNSTVCGPVDCSTALQHQGPPIITTTEFTASDCSATNGNSCEAIEAEEAEEDTQNKSTPTSSLDLHRASLTDLLAQGIKRVNSANNLAIPGIMSTLTGSGAAIGDGWTTGNTKSLPPSPQHSPSRSQSFMNSGSPFEAVISQLESLVTGTEPLSVQQVHAIAEPIINYPRGDDAMVVAKTAGKTLYSHLDAKVRVEKITMMLSKLRQVLDNEYASHTNLMLNQRSPLEGSSREKLNDSLDLLLTQSEERLQALSVVMLYLCTGLQHAQSGVASA